MDWLKRKAKGYSSASLRDALFAAILRGDADEFTDLCQRTAPLILQFFPDWTKAPDDVRNDPRMANAWAQCLLTIAQAFESAGRPELLATLMGGEDNPIVRWENSLAKANRLSDVGEYPESSRLLEDVLREMEGASGSAVDRYRPKIYGQLGVNAFRLGDYAAARRFTELALADCERTGDEKGVEVYAQNLATLSAVDADGPTAQCRRAVVKAQQLSDGMRYEYSNEILGDVLRSIEANPALLTYRAKARGLMGLNFYRVGDLARAREFTELALGDCDKGGDQAGARIYRENLRVIAAAAERR
jgi:hypothetical protein